VTYGLIKMYFFSSRLMSHWTHLCQVLSYVKAVTWPTDALLWYGE